MFTSLAVSDIVTLNRVPNAFHLSIYCSFEPQQSTFDPSIMYNCSATGFHQTFHQQCGHRHFAVQHLALPLKYPLSDIFFSHTIQTPDTKTLSVHPPPPKSPFRFSCKRLSKRATSAAFSRSLEPLRLSLNIF